MESVKQKVHEFRETQHTTRLEFSETTTAIMTLEWWVNNYFHSIPARTRLNLSDDIRTRCPSLDVGDKEELNENSNSPSPTTPSLQQ